MSEAGHTIPTDSRVIRYIKPAQMRRDESSTQLSIAVTAFQVGEHDTGLSVTWCEYFRGDSGEQVGCAIRSFERSYKPAKTGAFCILTVSQIFEAGIEANRNLIVKHTPECNNKAHAEIVGLDGNTLAQDTLAHLGSSSMVSVEDAKNLPLSECISNF